MNGEKPYDFVGFSDESPVREEGVGQDRIRPELLSGTLELLMRTLTPVHVGSGYTDYVKAGNQETLSALQASKRVREDGVPRRRYLIPGSSIKGAVRSIVEAITRSCVRVVQGKYRPYLPQGYGGCIRVDQLCPACRLFGAQDYQGHLSFEDAVAPKGSLVLLGTPLLWTPARRMRGLPPIYLGRRDQAKGRKFYYHAKYAQGADARTCIKTDAELPLRIHFVNLKEEELCVLFAALGLHPKHGFPIKVGAGKPVGLGTVKFQAQTLKLLQGRASLQQTGRLGQASIRQGKELEKWLQAYTQSNQSLIEMDALKQLAEVYAEGGLRNTASAAPY